MLLSTHTLHCLEGHLVLKKKSTYWKSYHTFCLYTRLSLSLSLFLSLSLSLSLSSSNFLLLPSTTRGIHDKTDYAKEGSSNQKENNAIVSNQSNNGSQAILGPPDDTDIFTEAESLFFTPQSATAEEQG